MRWLSRGWSFLPAVVPVAVVVLLAVAGGCSRLAPGDVASPTSVSGSGAAPNGETDADGPRTVRLPYGEAPSQFGELTVPPGAGPWPVVVLIHGGFWLVDFDLDLMRPLAIDLAGRGYAVWNIEYRGVGETGGAFPGTFDDVAAGVDFLASAADQFGPDLERVAFVGHSSGGHLALWVADRQDAIVDPVVVIGQAAVVDLRLAEEADLGRGAVRGLLLGGPEVVPERYLFAQPAIDPDRTVLIHGLDDSLVPFDQIEAPVAAGVPVVEFGEGDHFVHLDPTSPAWAAVVEILAERLG